MSRGRWLVACALANGWSRDQAETLALEDLESTVGVWVATGRAPGFAAWSEAQMAMFPEG